jgi:hypothetical protein
VTYNSFTAKRQLSGALYATVAAAKAALLTIYNNPHTRYKAIWFNVAGTIDVIDTNDTVVSVTGGVGSIYPLDSYGVRTGGGTTLTAGQFIYLYD